MTNYINSDKADANNDEHSNCWTWLAILQVGLGLLLVTASAFVYTLMHHPAVLIVSMMGAALLFQGTRAFLVCRHRPLFNEQNHPSAG